MQALKTMPTELYPQHTDCVFKRVIFSVVWDLQKGQTFEECLAEQNSFHPAMSGSEKRAREDRAWGTTISFKAHPQWPFTNHTPPLIGPSISQHHHRRAVLAAHSFFCRYPTLLACVLALYWLESVYISTSD